MRESRWSARRIVLGWTAWITVAGQLAAAPADPGAVASEVDRLLEGAPKLEKRSGPAPGKEGSIAVDDATFLRRVYLKVAGKLPSPDEVTYFALDADPEKRAAVVDRVLRNATEPGGDDVGGEWARNWARYWRDAVFARVQDRRSLAQRPVLEEWLAGKFRDDVGWDEIAREMIAASGDVSENGATGLIVAQQADPNNMAAETARLFLGIQIQCAQCHDHPYDDWRREQFHELAAFFPRVRLERKRDGDKRPGEVDQGFAQLIEDLRQRGRLDRTLIVWMGEFGRTPRINARSGRDHFPRAFNVALSGGGVRGGQAIGSTSADGMEVRDRPVTVPDLFCSIFRGLGIDPRIENDSALGRPIKLVDGGEAISELFG